MITAMVGSLRVSGSGNAHVNERGFVNLSESGSENAVRARLQMKMQTPTKKNDRRGRREVVGVVGSEGVKTLPKQTMNLSLRLTRWPQRRIRVG